MSFLIKQPLKTHKTCLFPIKRSNQSKISIDSKSHLLNGYIKRVSPKLINPIKINKMQNNKRLSTQPQHSLYRRYSKNHFFKKNSFNYDIESLKKTFIRESIQNKKKLLFQKQSLSFKYCNPINKKICQYKSSKESMEENRWVNYDVKPWNYLKQEDDDFGKINSSIVW